MKMNTRYCMILLIHLELITRVSSKIFNKVAQNQRPSQPPYKTTKIIEAEERCFSICSNDLKCYSFLVDQSNTSNLTCSLYNTTIDYLTLGEQDDEKKSVLHSVVPEMRDCLDWYNIGARETGIYIIVIPGGYSMRVRCNMEIDGGGWLVFQYRHNGQVDFQTNWKDYKQGFGSLESEFWLGNDILHSFTTRYDQEVYTQGERFNGEVNFAKYTEFKVDNEEQKYRLRVSGLTGAANLENGMKFSTPDSDNDQSSSGECSKMAGGRGGFWFNNCGKFFPNAKYHPTELVPMYEGIQWRTWISGHTTALKAVKMMIRRKV